PRRAGRGLLTTQAAACGGSLKSTEEYGDHALSIRHSRTPAVVAPHDAAGLAHLAADALHPGVPRLRGLPGLLRALAGAPSGELCRALPRPDLCARRGPYADLPGDRHLYQNDDRSFPVRLICPATALDQMAVGAVHPALGGPLDPDHSFRPLHVQS